MPSSIHIRTSRAQYLFPGEEVEVLPQVGEHAGVIGVAGIFVYRVVAGDHSRIQHAPERALQSPGHHEGEGLVEVVVVTGGDRGAGVAHHIPGTRARDDHPTAAGGAADVIIVILHQQPDELVLLYIPREQGDTHDSYPGTQGTGPPPTPSK